MSKRQSGAEGGHAIGGLFTFALFGMFVLLSLLIVVIGADGYRRVVSQGESVGAIRTTLGYVAGKVNNGAGEERIEITQYGDMQVLTLMQLGLEGERVHTAIYHQDGALYEQNFIADEMDFDPESGSRLVEIAALEMEMVGDGLIKLTATAADGRSQSVHVAVRTNQEVAGR